MASSKKNQKKSSGSGTRPKKAKVENPPTSTPWKRRSFWVVALGEIREVPQKWHRVERLYTKSTAQQIASDVRCAHLRPASVHRVRGFEPDEIWESKWIPTTGGAPGDCEVWVRYLGEKFNLAEAS